MRTFLSIVFASIAMHVNDLDVMFIFISLAILSIIKLKPNESKD